MKLSEYDDNGMYEEASVLFFRDIALKKKWKYRTQEKDNDIDGELEIFGHNKQTTARFLKIQLKASFKVKYKNGDAIFDCPIKFLNFCDICDFPVIIVLYEVQSNKSYWIWTQEYIFNTLDNNNPSWRSNSDSVRIKFPLSQEVLSEGSFYEQMEYIANNGVNEIQQLRKRDTSEYYYSILMEKDNSKPHRNISAKVYVERSFANSRDAMLELIKKVNSKIIKNNYNKNVLKDISGLEEPKIVFINFYDDIAQLKVNLPLCRTEWVQPNQGMDFISLNNYDDFLKEDNIRVKWESSYRPLEEHLRSNAVTKNEYLVSVKQFIKFAKQELANIYSLFKSEKVSFHEHITNNKDLIKDMWLKLSDSELPPYECVDFHEILIDSISIIEGLATDVTAKNGNDYYLETLHIDKFPQKLAVLEHELEKIL
ncbi:DUF4365 domain-containing protein [Peribacillus simplex]|uniref:DUF4365 domain-containing protein n=1 Tax=Peribacillus simplex TaxID=1478 RepID=UPI00298DA1E6|nr:DUF4365 domain-containing protein [Peribacillus simplex]MDW7615167.1 DUF4365 domain-containing protein [Peribacillus simplex]